MLFRKDEEYRDKERVKKLYRERGSGIAHLIYFLSMFKNEEE